MKKIFVAAMIALLALCMMTTAMAESDLKIGQVQYAAHGTKCFAVMTVVMEGDVIAAAYIDEYQTMAVDAEAGVPNSENMFGEGVILASKRANSEFYSANMAKAGSTVAIADNYAAIEAYVTGKTVAELEAEIEGKDSAAMIDVVSGCTLADTLGYVMGLIEAAKAAL